MKGCRPLTDVEIRAILGVLDRGRTPARDRALLLLGIRTGFRISELLSLTRESVFTNGRVKTRVSVPRRFMKGKKASREVVLHPEAQDALEELLREIPQAPDTFLFLSREGKNQRLHRSSAWDILKKAFDACQLDGKLATHSMRKTFAWRVYIASGRDIRKVQEAMGHADLNSTAAYIGVSQSEVDDLILKA